MALADQLRELLDPVVEDLGYRIYGLDCRPHASNGLLRMYIEVDGREINIDDCAKVSREVSGLLDVHDPIPGNYNLEVSSPGLDRPLYDLEHYQRFTGEIVALSTFAPVDGRRKFKARIERVEQDMIHLEQDDQQYVISPDNIAKAKLVPQW